MEEILVIDIGGTKTNVSFVSSVNNEIKIVSSDVFPTPSKPDSAIEKIESIFKSRNKPITSMSLSLPGKWDSNGVLKESFFLHGWLEYPFIENLAKRLNIKKYIWESDVICGALGEYDGVGIGRDQSLLYINLGTGIGAALIKDGKPFKSGMEQSRQFPEQSRRFPTLRMQKLVLPYEDELYSGVDLISGGSLIQVSKYNSVETLFKDYKAGKPEAFHVISKSQTQLAAWIINLFYLFAPDIIVLGGGLTNEWEVLAEGAIEIANEELENEVKILPGKLKELAPIYGAYMNYKCHCEESASGGRRSNLIT